MKTMPKWFKEWFNKDYCKGDSCFHSMDIALARKFAYRAYVKGCRKRLSLSSYHTSRTGPLPISKRADEMNENEVEILVACEKFKRENHIPFCEITHVIAIMEKQGWKKKGI